MARHAFPPARPRTPRSRIHPGAEDGGLIIEVIVAALLVGLLAVGIFSALDAASARTGAIKSRAIAANVAQADLERMRAMELSNVSNLRETYTKTLDGIPFVVSSRADWVSDASGTASCASASASKADYLKISSTVTWPAMAGIRPVVLTSVIAPPSGSFGTNQGSLAVQVTDPAGQPVVGKTVSLSGPASFTESTNELGCVLWGFLVAGNYTVTLGGGCMDHLGNDPVSTAASVTGGAVNAISLECGVPGTISANADTVPRNVSNVVQAAKSAPLRWLTVAHSGMGGTGMRLFGTGSPVTSITTSPLYPFTDPYAVYGGNCARQDPRTAPNTGTAVMQTAPPGGTVGPVTVRQPAINVDVDDGTTQISGATVTAVVDSILTPGCSGTYTFTTNSGGQITDPGVPYGTYDLCAQANIASAIRRVRIADVPNTGPTGTNTQRFAITAASTAGTCP
jgi:Tfp pilus assembly protein PilV